MASKKATATATETATPNPDAANLPTIVNSIGARCLGAIKLVRAFAESGGGDAMKIAGIVESVDLASNQDGGEFHEFKGQFLADGIGGKYQSSRCIIPGPIGEIMYNALANAGKVVEGATRKGERTQLITRIKLDTPQEFAVMVGVEEKESSPTGYMYTSVNLLAPSEPSHLDRLMAVAGGSTPSRFQIEG